ncbi:RxLR effector protein [Phytophthora megakarya]|uniref:RxLR effector protein n=1 Tax=Phytophthora megakarya TaxID=4795 RepID=A0A225VKJ1_9STRA|nr:RxLR effector protein [Phytophthora megakarya]
MWYSYMLLVATTAFLTNCNGVPKSANVGSNNPPPPDSPTMIPSFGHSNARRLFRVHDTPTEDIDLVEFEERMPTANTAKQIVAWLDNGFTPAKVKNALEITHRTNP